MKWLAIAFLLILPVGAVYYAGVFKTAFDTNACYAEVLGTLSDQAQAAAAVRDSARMARYARLMQSLPLRGYESQCEKSAGWPLPQRHQADRQTSRAVPAHGRM